MADPLASWMWTSLTEPPQHVGHVVVNMDVFDGSVPEVVEKFVLPAAPDSDPQEGQVDLKEYSGGGQITGREEIKNPDIAEIEDQMETEEDLISIWRLHSSIREQESEAYEPKIVSIGPLHHGKKRLHAMEQTKWRYVQSLIDRSPNNSIRYYIRAIHECEDHVRKQYYPEELKSYPQKDFVKLLVRDGCFIVEYFLRNFFKVDLDMADDSGWVPSLVRRDLMLFENQIPYFVLVKLFEETHIGDVRVREISPYLMDLALRSLGVEGDLPQVKPQEVDKALHLLHLLHLYHRRRLINYDLTEQQQSTADHHSQEVPKMIPNAIELDKAGVKFKKKDDVDSPLKVSFSNGLLEIPSLSVDEETSTRLRNFIAFEQSFNDVKNHFISYAFFMDNIINTESDVALLRKHKIIQSKLGSDKEVANMFNKLCKGTYINYGNHYNAGLFVDVNAYCEVPLNRWRASLKSTHLRNPWTVISLLAGILLISLALIQTIFTIIK